jgi:two-component system phosphate regulon response regulator PhoB
MKAKRKQPEVEGQPMQGEPASVLVVEDEADLQELLRHNLTRHGFAVRSALDGGQALRAVAEQLPDLIVLDVMLPVIDGLEVCRRLRSDPRSAGIPVIMLTARTEETDVIRGLDLGADDYVTKPFRMRELVARMKACLRRPLAAAAPREGDARPEAGSVLRHGPLVLDQDRHEASVDGQPLQLTATEFRVLTLLLRRPGRVFNRQQIIDGVHDGLAAVSARSVDVQIVTLRRRLGAHADWIETVRGVGYRLREQLS